MSHRSLLSGYDEPETLSYQIRLFGHISADPGHLIKFIDSSGNESTNYAVFTNNFTDSKYNYVDQLTEHATFAGTKSNCTVSGSDLQLDSGQTVLTYTFSNSLDLGSVEACRLVPEFVATITDTTTTVADYDPVGGVSRFSGPFEAADVTFEIRHTDDDPTGTPTWSAWETLLIGIFNHRAFEFRVVGEVASTAHTILFSEIGILADKLDLVQSGNETSSASADTTVTFGTSFYSGVSGTSKPRVGANIIGASLGDEVVVLNRTKDSFDFSVYDSGGSRIVGEIDWQAIGQ